MCIFVERFLGPVYLKPKYNIETPFAHASSEPNAPSSQTTHWLHPFSALSNGSDRMQQAFATASSPVSVIA